MQEWGLRCNWDYTVGSDVVTIDFLVLGERTSTLWKKNKIHGPFNILKLKRSHAMRSGTFDAAH